MPSQLTNAAAILGAEARKITVQADVLRRLPAIVIVGMPSASVREGAERVRCAIVESGFRVPRGRVVVTLSPADVRKVGTQFDLAIAVAVLRADGQLPEIEGMDEFVFHGELSLMGRVRPSRGALAVAARGKTVVCCPEDARRIAEAGWKARAIANLGDLEAVLLAGGNEPAPVERAETLGGELDFADVVVAKEALDKIADAARTRRTVVLRGPPGCGKTMLAARMKSLLPKMTAEEARQVLIIQDTAGLRPTRASVADIDRPFRAPHHSVSLAGLTVGADPRPGEAVLAHKGVLFLDEYPEFRREARETLRNVMEDRKVCWMARTADGPTAMPADFWLVVAANPCQCGYRGHPARKCICSDDVVRRYNARWENDPLLRDAVVVDLAPVDPALLLQPGGRRTSAELRARIAEPAVVRLEDAAN